MPIKNKEIIDYHYERKVALGVFDGVHKGHQKLIEKSSFVMTFNPHPQILTKPYNDGILLLTTLEEKQSLIPHLLVLQFSQDIAALSPREFVEEILIKELSIDAVIVGYDYVFGKSRSGTVEDLIRFGKEYDFRVEVIDKVKKDGIIIKSSYIRSLIGNGMIEDANKLLGREYFVFGVVGHGKQLGRTLGFATANLVVPPDKLLPPQGVYGGKILVDQQIHDCAINVALEVQEGSVTTKHDDLIIEAHIFDFNQNIYGKKVVLYFSFFVRNEIKFSSLDDLKAQISKDVLCIRERITSR
ncbi:MAG: riboflavin biosynthesis protein RibF [Candidatus Margulisiibacteriota bacterium]|nr:MAG: riboflavin biosynthesis protein RibF [Candidatus Margulisbacteria bacterium GWD2_39_127]OGI01591.1 MAG: riboflavin biosynthesis protein RibF [Candidatus Margulisbacteria bacterium GWF2_38_17]OGI10033.1 MAG: riboflavin biosynthesis protein RibF [Candidatus Margulisbacteria bacterium GWE2_39_32]PZM78288.1 MAG: riboflavin biosynthesis protein RibF [Candidatus Margulisiibacteriota bacterium]HAR62264.1 riboflavin biosynthesis protein RibF [Candidatus Margulisiibacteriota bacterium]